MKMIEKLLFIFVLCSTVSLAFAELDYDNMSNNELRELDGEDLRKYEEYNKQHRAEHYGSYEAIIPVSVSTAGPLIMAPPNIEDLIIELPDLSTYFFDFNNNFSDQLEGSSCCSGGICEIPEQIRKCGDNVKNAIIGSENFNELMLVGTQTQANLLNNIDQLLHPIKAGSSKDECAKCIGDPEELHQSNRKLVTQLKKNNFEKHMDSYEKFKEHSEVLYNVLQSSFVAYLEDLKLNESKLDILIANSEDGSVENKVLSRLKVSSENVDFNTELKHIMTCKNSNYIDQVYKLDEASGYICDIEKAGLETREKKIDDELQLQTSKKMAALLDREGSKVSSLIDKLSEASQIEKLRSICRLDPADDSFKLQYYDLLRALLLPNVIEKIETKDLEELKFELELSLQSDDISSLIISSPEFICDNSSLTALEGNSIKFDAKKVLSGILQDQYLEKVKSLQESKFNEFLKASESACGKIFNKTVLDSLCFPLSVESYMSGGFNPEKVMRIASFGDLDNESKFASSVWMCQILSNLSPEEQSQMDSYLDLASSEKGSGIPKNPIEVVQRTMENLQRNVQNEGKDVASVIKNRYSSLSDSEPRKRSNLSHRGSSVANKSLNSMINKDNESKSPVKVTPISSKPSAPSSSGSNNNLASSGGLGQNNNFNSNSRVPTAPIPRSQSDDLFEKNADLRSAREPIASQIASSSSNPNVNGVEELSRALASTDGKLQNNLGISPEKQSEIEKQLAELKASMNNRINGVSPNQELERQLRQARDERDGFKERLANLETKSRAQASGPIGLAGNAGSSTQAAGGNSAGGSDGASDGSGARSSAGVSNDGGTNFGPGGSPVITNLDQLYRRAGDTQIEINPETNKLYIKSGQAVYEGVIDLDQTVVNVSTGEVQSIFFNGEIVEMIELNGASKLNVTRYIQAERPDLFLTTENAYLKIISDTENKKKELSRTPAAQAGFRDLEIDSENIVSYRMLMQSFDTTLEEAKRGLENARSN